MTGVHWRPEISIPKLHFESSFQCLGPKPVSSYLHTKPGKPGEKTFHTKHVGRSVTKYHLMPIEVGWSPSNIDLRPNKQQIATTQIIL